MNNQQRNLLIICSLLTVGFSVASGLAGSIWCGIFTFCLGASLTGIFVLEIRRREKRMQELNSYLSLVCSGQYELEVAENTEGELSILQNNLYKVIVLLQTQNERLKKDKVFLRDSLADISHQLKTPLTSLTVMTDLLKGEMDEVKRQEFIHVMEGQQERMNWLVATLLKLSKLDAETVEFHKEPIFFETLLKESVKPFLLTMDLRNIGLEISVEPCMVCLDRAWSVEGFGNIFKNCIEHMKDGGVLSVRSVSTALYDAVFIKDTGCGIAEEDLPHIFERFYRGKEEGKDSVGIGLALSKKIFEKQQGEIFVTSEEGVGTEFEVRFYKVVV